MQIFDSLTDADLVSMVQSGGIGVLPTDTLYGLVASARNPEAVARMYALKRREQKPGTTIAATPEQLVDLGINPALVAEVATYWPGPLSVVFPLSDDLAYLHQGVGESPFRVVAHDGLRALLEQTGPLVTSSANQPGEPPARTIAEAQAYFGETVDFYVDGGAIQNVVPSTIVRATEAGLTVLRQGAYQLEKRGA